MGTVNSAASHGKYTEDATTALATVSDAVSVAF